MSVNYISLKHIGHRLPGRNGKAMSIPAIRRRIIQGINGIRLRAMSNGSEWFTTEQWIQEFLTAATGYPVGREDAELGHAQAMERLQQRYGVNANEMPHQRLHRGRRPAGLVR